MKVKKLTVKNIGKIEYQEIKLDKPLNIFYGEIKAGKTTLAINSIKLLFGGSFSKDIIRHGEDEGFVKLEFDNAMIKRRYRYSRNHEIKADPIEYLSSFIFIIGIISMSPATTPIINITNISLITYLPKPYFLLTAFVLS